MPSVLRELPLTYAVLPVSRWCGTVSAVHEPSPASPYRFSSAAKQLLAQCDNRLICVRHRYDTEQGKRLKTVEILVEERDWEPPRRPFAHDHIVRLRVAFTDVAVRDRVKQAGGNWNPERRVWQWRYARVLALGLKTRIVDEPASNTGCPPSRGEHLHADARAASR